MEQWRACKVGMCRRGQAYHLAVHCEMHCQAELCRAGPCSALADGFHLLGFRKGQRIARARAVAHAEWSRQKLGGVGKAGMPRAAASEGPSCQEPSKACKSTSGCSTLSPVEGAGTC